LEIDLIINVSFPDKFRHIHSVILNRDFKDFPVPLELIERLFYFRELDPRLGIVGKAGEVFFVELAHSVDIGHLQLHLYVLVEDLGTGTLPKSHAQHLSSLIQVLAAQVELRIHDPDFVEGELLVRDQLEQPLVECDHISRSFRIHLLEYNIVISEVNVAASILLFLSQRDLLNRSFERFADSREVFGHQFEIGQVEPGVIVGDMLGQLLLVESSPLVQHQLVDLFLLAMQLLED